MSASPTKIVLGLPEWVQKARFSGGEVNLANKEPHHSPKKYPNLTIYLLRSNICICMYINTVYTTMGLLTKCQLTRFKITTLVSTCHTFGKLIKVASNNITMAPFSSTITISAPTLPTNVHNNVFEVENDDVFGNLNWIDDKLAVADDLFANNQNNNTLLWLPDDNLFQLLPELEFQASSLSPCSPDDHLLGSIHSPHDEVCNAVCFNLFVLFLPCTFKNKE